MAAKQTSTKKKPTTRKVGKKKTATRTRPARGKGRLAPDETRALLVGTAKGAFIVERGRSGRWTLSDPLLLGSRIHDFRRDPRDGRTLLLTATGGHLGPTIHRSLDFGVTLQEATKPPAFRKAKKVKAGGKKKDRTERHASRGLAVKINFWLSPGHRGEPGSWFCGTSPHGIFRSDDGGETWKGLRGFNEGENYDAWTFGGRAETPDGAFLHSIAQDPRNPRHIYLSMSIGGTFESIDGGKNWRPLNRGIESDFLPDPTAEFGQDPHHMIVHPADPDILYQQNHCGIYRMDRTIDDLWVRVGKNMPEAVGDIGFPIVGHPEEPNTVWVFPMDGTKLWPRTSPDAKPAVYVTRNGGKTWRRLAKGLPRKQAWFTVKRQAMCRDSQLEPNIYFGTTSGELWMGRDGGTEFECIARHLPQIYSVSVATK